MKSIFLELKASNKRLAGSEKLSIFRSKVIRRTNEYSLLVLITFISLINIYNINQIAIHAFFIN